MVSTTLMKQKRYTSERQILDAIDRMKENQALALAEAESLDTEAAIKIELDNPKLLPAIQWARRNSKVAKARAERYEKKLHIMGQKLSAFRTELLPMNGNTDKGVV